MKCKMCDAPLKYEEGSGTATCEFCGSIQTIPKVREQRIADLYERAGQYRYNNEFDKALALYEEIIKEDITDAEAYWSVILCKYGIEYVEEDGSGKRVPTINRAQYTSIYEDAYYDAAIKYGDEEQVALYKREAEEINRIQKGILLISKTADQYDIFICYKETDNNGRRTVDSVLADNLYEKLTEEGYRVFFARVSLEDKIGVAYEPYIFAALQSSKIMIVVGTRKEHFEAVWVRNEWSRYLALMQKEKDRMLIPAYKDMDPYDMPKEFSHLQGIDMSVLGYDQDMIEGIRKILKPEGKQNAARENTLVTGSETGYIERAYLYLEEKEWDKALECLENALNFSAKNAESYMGILMAKNQAATKDEFLHNTKGLIMMDRNYDRVMAFGTEEQKALLTEAVRQSGMRNQEKHYQKTLERMQREKGVESLIWCRNIFSHLGDYKDSKELSKQCEEAIPKAREDEFNFYKGLLGSRNRNSLEAAEEYFRKTQYRPDEAKRLLNTCLAEQDRLEETGQ